jgi:hypothetical protein
MGLIRGLLASRYRRFMWSYLSEADRNALWRYDGTAFKDRDLSSQLGILGGISLVRNLLARTEESSAAFDAVIAELRKEGGVALSFELPGLEHHPRAAVAYLCLGAFYAQERRVPRAVWRTVALRLFDEVERDQSVA